MAEVDLGALYFQPQNGRIAFEARVKLESTTVAASMGFNDETTESSNSLPVELSGTTFTSNAATFAGFVVDSDATNDNWHVFWVDDDTDTTTAIADLNTGVPLAADTWYTLKVELYDNGSGNPAVGYFFVSDGTNSFSKQFTTNIDRDVSLVPHIGVENRTTTGAYIDIDYIEGGQTRQA